jgi:hypothetical protein
MSLPRSAPSVPSLSAAIQYLVQCPANGFPAALANLGPGDGSCAAVSAIDSILASGIKSGYSISYTPGAANAVDSQKKRKE